MSQDKRPPLPGRLSSAAGGEPREKVLSLLSSGEVELQGRMPWSSNATFLATVSISGDPGPSGGDGGPGGGGPGGGGRSGSRREEGSFTAAIYKPLRGERPLWDFPGGLYRREVAAFELAQGLGWDLVPETVLRHDAPLGEGSLQRFVDADFEQHYFTILEGGGHHCELRRMAVFDLVANNADRKGGHCLLDYSGHLWGIDHGLCFHPQPKLRTVIWDFAGEKIPTKLIDDLAGFAERPLPEGLANLLSSDERRALAGRIGSVVRRRRFPTPRSERPYPWPLV